MHSIRTRPRAFCRVSDLKCQMDITRCPTGLPLSRLFTFLQMSEPISLLAGTLVVRDLQAIGIDAQLRTIADTSMSSIWYQGINMYFEKQNFGYPNSELLTDESFYSYFTTAGPTQTSRVRECHNQLRNTMQPSLNWSQQVIRAKDTNLNRKSRESSVITSHPYPYSIKTSSGDLTEQTLADRRLRLVRSNCREQCST